MAIDEEIHNLIVARAPREEIRKKAQVSGMVSLKDDGIQKIRESIVTIEEVMRLTEEGRGA